MLLGGSSAAAVVQAAAVAAAVSPFYCVALSARFDYALFLLFWNNHHVVLAVCYEIARLACTYSAPDADHMEDSVPVGSRERVHS